MGFLGRIRSGNSWHPGKAQRDRMARLAPRHHTAAIHEDVRAEHAHHCRDVRKRHLLSRSGAHRDIFTDSDWASDKDRKSVSCVVTMIGEHCIRCHIATQSAPALSSGEAEYVDNVKGTSIGTGMQSMARDFGDERVVRIATDSSASKGSASRLGLGEIRHLDTGLLWVQHRVRRKVQQLVKTLGS